jgi:hypothetical protein
MLLAILAFFKAVPAITGGITAFTTAYYNAKVQIKTAQIGGDVSVAKQLISGIVAEGQVRVEFLKTVAQSKFLMWIVGLFAGPWIIYEWKVVVWDNIVAFAIYGKYGFTPPIEGTVGTWAGIILTGIFGAGTVMAGAQMYFNRRER